MSIYAHSNPYMEGKCMGFCSTEVWVMGYGRIMGFGSKIPANRVGGRDFLWVMAGYGLPRVWVKTGSTVRVMISFQFSLHFASRRSGRVANLKRSPSQIRIGVNLAPTPFQWCHDG